MRLQGRGDGLFRGGLRRGFRGLMVVSGFMDYVHDAARRVATVVEWGDCKVKRFFRKA